MTNLRTLVFYIVVIDFSLMPMFHFLGLPYKPGLLIVGIVALLKWYRKPCRLLFFYFFGLILACWIGATYQHLFFPTQSINFTIYCTTSYLLGFIGFCFGYYYAPKNVDKILPIALVLILINLVIGAFWDKLPFLTEFYNLQVRIEDDYFSRKNAGLFSNPNISSLVINMFLLFITMANNFKLFAKNRVTYTSIIWVLAFVALLTMMSKNQLIAFAILSLFLLKQINISRLKNCILQYFLLIVIVLSIYSFASNHLTTSSVFKSGVHLFPRLPSRMYRMYIAPEFDIQDKGDRRVKYLYALKAFSYSPIWGSGFDRADSGIFSEESKIGYHSDWSYLVVAGGILAVIFFLLILYTIWRIHPLLLLPFFFPGLTNSFMLTAQLFCLYGIFWGVLKRGRVSGEICEKSGYKAGIVSGVGQ
jgi:hypothetical protein